MSTAQGVESNVVVVLQSQEMRRNYNMFHYLVWDSKLGRSSDGNHHYTVFVIMGGLVVKAVVLWDMTSCSMVHRELYASKMQL